MISNSHRKITCPLEAITLLYFEARLFNFWLHFTAYQAPQSTFSQDIQAGCNWRTNSRAGSSEEQLSPAGQGRINSALQVGFCSTSLKLQWPLSSCWKHQLSSDEVTIVVSPPDWLTLAESPSLTSRTKQNFNVSLKPGDGNSTTWKNLLNMAKRFWLSPVLLVLWCM